MKNKKNVEKYINIIIYIILIGIIIILLNNQNFMIGKGINIIKQKSETEQVTNLQKQLDALNSTQTEYANYIQGCKTQIATALTNEGIATSNEEKLEIMAENISKIFQTRTSDATATEEDILEGKTAYVNGELITGNKKVKGQNTIIKLGVGTSFDLSSYDGYENFSTDNFIVCVQPQTINLYTDGSEQGQIVTNYFIIGNPSITYNNETGNLSISCIGDYGIGKMGYHYQSHNLSCLVYLVI